MILHFLEVWALFLLVFVVGCGLGAAVHAGLAAGCGVLVKEVKLPSKMAPCSPVCDRAKSGPPSRHAEAHITPVACPVL